MPRPLNFRHIEALRAIVLTGTVTGAGQLLHLSQPAISNTLREAEESMGMRLFERRGTHLLPNKVAQALFEAIERSFTGLDEINALAQHLREGRTSHLSIIAVPMLAITVLPQVIAAWQREDPQTFISCEERHAKAIGSLVAAGKADIGFGVETPAVPGLASECLAEAELVCLLPAQHRLAVRGEPVHGRDLCGEPMIRVAINTGTDALIDQALFQCEKLRPLVVAQCATSIAACALVEQGMGFVLTPPGAAVLFDRSRLAIQRFLPLTTFRIMAYWVEGRLPERDRFRLVEKVRRQWHIVTESVMSSAS